jgi:hypothetical protein
MSVARLSAAVAAGSAVGVAALGAAAAALAGGRAGLGVAAGGALGVAGFWRMARDAERVTAALAGGGRLRIGWLAGAAARLLGVGAALGALLASGWAHPVGLVLGLAVVPAAVVVQGLRLARAAGED